STTSTNSASTMYEDRSAAARCFAREPEHAQAVKGRRSARGCGSSSGSCETSHLASSARISADKPYAARTQQIENGVHRRPRVGLDAEASDEELAELSFQGFRDRVIRYSGEKSGRDPRITRQASISRDRVGRGHWPHR